MCEISRVPQRTMCTRVCRKACGDNEVFYSVKPLAGGTVILQFVAWRNAVFASERRGNCVQFLVSVCLFHFSLLFYIFI